MKWAQVTVITSQDASDAVANYLFECDAIGLEMKDPSSLSPPFTTLIAYFPMDDRVGERVQKLRRFLAQLPLFGVDAQPAEVELRCVEDENWSETWKSAFPPQKIGKRILIAPTWHEITLEASDVLIRLDPGMAFGTGHHPTTQLSMELLEGAIKGNEVVADIGTGSGILAITAARLGAERVDAVELDATAIPIAQKNFQLNRVESIVHLHHGDGLKGYATRVYPYIGKYDLIVANILTKVILPMIPQCPRLLHSRGGVILSGIMAKEVKQVEGALETNGFRCLETRTQEEWTGIWAKLECEA